MAPKDTGLSSLSLIQPAPEPAPPPAAKKATPKPATKTTKAKPAPKPATRPTVAPVTETAEEPAARVGVMYRCTPARRKALHQLALDRGVKVQTLLDEAVELLALQHDSKL